MTFDELLHVSVEHTSVPKKDLENFTDALETIEGAGAPNFATYKPGMTAIKKLVNKHVGKVDHLVIISNGGSRTTAWAFAKALRDKRNEVGVTFVSTQEPDYLDWLKGRLDKKKTLIMPISKSGTNVDMLEPLSVFLDGWNVLPVTSPEKGLLYAMAKEKKWDIIPHPDISGRFSGRSETAFAAAHLLGLDINAINEGALTAYEACGPDVPMKENLALQLAAHLAILEKQGKDDVFVPVYSTKLTGFLPLIVQLMHESCGKDGKGQTYFGDEAPESQHHTNQRFFGGQKNVVGLFLTVDQYDNERTKIGIPKEFRDLELRDGTLGDLHNIKLADAIRFDFEGVHRTAVDKRVPHAVISVHKINEGTVGALLGFLQYFTYYSAMLRGQNPFDQPEVEDSKELSWQLRKNA